ncbi:MAG TPA: DNA repair protein RecN [Paludibacter sp.]|nr:DNA repair protein RecN [Paludibacter sp.]
MLKSLYISNYALIAELRIDFESGFTVITGETGAGKSIILGALSLILGQRADSKFIKADADKCVIEAEFDISSYQHLNSFFEQNNLDNESSTCLVRRELSSSGKSRSFINDTPVSLNIVRDLSLRLIDIHSQHENLLLSNMGYQLDVVDTVADNQEIVKNYSAAYHQWRSQLAELRLLQKTAEKKTADLDYLQFQYNQLAEAKLLENEQADLEAELETLSHAEEIKLELLKANQLLEAEQMVLPLLKEATGAISKIKAYIARDNDWHERLHSAFVELKDIASELTAFEERIEFNPARLEWVGNRLSELYTLQKKYKVSSIRELIDIREDFGRQLQQIESFDEDMEALKSKIAVSASEVESNAAKLTQSRENACKPIEDYLVDQLTRLGMPNIRFEVSLTHPGEFAETGNDEVQFLFSANKNRPLQPVSQIASGGEVSRVMLSIKSLIAHKADLPTIIFDEIDTGVSGEIAHRMGEIMQAMSSDMQVITITHLPQIAAKGAQHFKVYKDESGSHTQTHIQYLDMPERINELAQMLSGKGITDAALRNASELLLNN